MTYFQELREVLKEHEWMYTEALESLKVFAEDQGNYLFYIIIENSYFPIYYIVVCKKIVNLLVNNQRMGLQEILETRSLYSL